MVKRLRHARLCDALAVRLAGDGPLAFGSQNETVLSNASRILISSTRDSAQRPMGKHTSVALTFAALLTAASATNDPET